MKQPAHQKPIPREFGTYLVKNGVTGIVPVLFSRLELGTLEVANRRTISKGEDSLENRTEIFRFF